MKIYRTLMSCGVKRMNHRTQAYEGLEKGEDVESIGTSVLYHNGMMLR